ncbi:hypothetical protein AB835_12670 [Candidatus Endobugula sertula]|uniref:Uncharacterized protein n=1 Tax=Candidatus Endobugula sertula TaxID=62101 RepID=A0A1D2QMA3_9GAMM|nr:hypothetical protein AB835_12670 [Candidatus Endobugula sertula]
MYIKLLLFFILMISFQVNELSNLLGILNGILYNTDKAVQNESTVSFLNNETLVQSLIHSKFDGTDTYTQVNQADWECDNNKGDAVFSADI